MKRIRGKRVLAAAIKAVVIAGGHWDQHFWISGKYFDNYAKVATGTELRDVLTRNVRGTTSCVAGTAIILTLPESGTYEYGSDMIRLKDGTRMFAPDYAQDALGLDDGEATWLFASHRSKADVMQALDLLIAGKRLYTLMH